MRNSGLRGPSTTTPCGAVGSATGCNRHCNLQVTGSNPVEGKDFFFFASFPRRLCYAAPPSVMTKYDLFLSLLLQLFLRVNLKLPYLYNAPGNFCH